MKDFFLSSLNPDGDQNQERSRPAGPKPHIHRLSSYFCKCAGMSVALRAADTKITQMSDGNKNTIDYDFDDHFVLES